MSPFMYRLISLHTKLDAEIRCEQQRRTPDPWRLLRLKKLRLAIKDRMRRFLVVRPHGMA